MEAVATVILPRTVSQKGLPGTPALQVLSKQRLQHSPNMHSSCSMQVHQHRCNSTMFTSCSYHGNSTSQCSSFKPHHIHGSKSYRRVVVRAGSNGAENGRLTSEKQREIAKILLQTQKNMLELNNSRVKVQEELAMAHRRIADLGACVGSRSVCGRIRVE